MRALWAQMILDFSAIGDEPATVAMGFNVPIATAPDLQREQRQMMESYVTQPQFQGRDPYPTVVIAAPGVSVLVILGINGMTDPVMLADRLSFWVSRLGATAWSILAPIWTRGVESAEEAASAPADLSEDPLAREAIRVESYDATTGWISEWAVVNRGPQDTLGEWEGLQRGPDALEYVARAIWARTC